MPNKCCGAACSCKLSTPSPTSGAPYGLDAIKIIGTGSSQDPFVVSFKGITIDNSADQVELNLVYDDAAGYTIGAVFDPASELSQIGNVSTTAPTNAQVLTWDSSTSKWKPAAAPTAAPGAITTDTSLTGDGSSGHPLEILQDPAGFTETRTAGNGLTKSGRWALVQKFATSLARNTATTTGPDASPPLNALSSLDTAPGLVDYWNGTAWTPLLLLIGGPAATSQFQSYSGNYVAGGAMKIFVKQFSIVVGTAGACTFATPGDLTGYAGVLSAWINPNTGIVFQSVLDAHTPITATTGITGKAYGATGSVLASGTTIKGTVTAICY